MKYKISFHTGAVKGAGTDAYIYVQLIGSKTKTKELRLNSKLSQFEKGDRDNFFIETENLGNIEKIKLSHDGKNFGSDWFLNEVIIESIKQKKIWYFPVYKWIKKNTKITFKSVKNAVYHFEITTGILPNSGTNDKIQISLVGSKSYTPFIDLTSYVTNNKFTAGHTEKFSTVFEDVGKIQEIKIKCPESSKRFNWYLNKIKLKKNYENSFSTFNFYNWVKPEKIYSLSKNLHCYTVKIYTGAVASGGTDANVSMIIYGTKGTTETIHLNDLISRNAFEAGNIDYIKLAHKYLGAIIKIKIWHDQKWLADGWFLNKILISKDNTGSVSEFPYYSWLDKSADPDSTSIELIRKPIIPRPFYVIAHMVNTPAYLEEALNLGSNAAEFDIMPKLNDDGNFSFDVFHGFRPDFDPDKINLMERSIARTELSIFLDHLRQFEVKYKSFSLVVYDCKLENVPQKKLELCGEQLAREVVQNFYCKNNSNRIFTIFSIGRKKSVRFFDGVVKSVPKYLLPLIGFDFSMEKFASTEKVFENRKESNFWWGSGIASTIPKPLKHFIPQFLIAAKKRTKRGIIKKIYYWTLDDPNSMARILVTKLDGIIVNDPLKLLKVLDKEEFKHSYRLATRNDNPFSIT